MFEWDERKAAINLAKHNVKFDAAREFDFDTAIEHIDDREDYGETRIVALGFIGVSLHVLIYAPQDDGTYRIISLRRATKSEQKDYVKAQA